MSTHLGSIDANRSARNRAQSHTVGVILLTAVIVILMGVFGAFYLGVTNDRADSYGPLVDAEVNATAERVTVVHNGGDSVRFEELAVVVSGNGSRARFDVGAANVTGNGDDRFDPTERFARDHGLGSGEMEALVIHDDSNTVLRHSYLDVPPLTGGGGDTGDGGPLVWDTASDWDGGVSEDGVVHESFGDHDAGVVELGYPTGGQWGPTPVAYWPLDEDGGSTAADVVGSEDGTVEGDPTLGDTGLFASSGYTMDGSGDGVTVPDSPTVEMSDQDAVSVSAWVRKDAAQSSWIAIAQHSDTSYNLQFQNGDEPAFTVHDGDWQEATSGVTASTGQWYHLVGTYDGSTATIYVDGQPEGSAAASGMSGGGSNPLAIGYNDDTGGRTLEGAIDEVGLYDHALTDDEVQSLYEAGQSGTLTTGGKTLDANVSASTLTLTNGSASRPAGTDVTVYVEADTAHDGSFAATSDPITLDGSGSYAVTGISGDADTFRLRIDLSSTTPTNSPRVGNLTLSAP